MEQPDIDTSTLSLTVQRGPPTAASGHAHLKVIKERARVGLILAGGRDVTVLGRNSKMSHEVLEHHSISRRHAALVHNGDGDVFAADLGSTHGTYVNGCKIPARTATRLSDGDILKFGESSRWAVILLSSHCEHFDDMINWRFLQCDLIPRWRDVTFGSFAPSRSDDSWPAGLVGDVHVNIAALSDLL